MRALSMIVGLLAALPALAQAPLAPEQERLLKPKDTFKECTDCPEMLVLAPSTYLIGSPPSEHARDDNEGPRHRVTIRAFALGKFEVTVEQFATFVDETKHNIGTGCDIWLDGK